MAIRVAGDISDHSFHQQKCPMPPTTPEPQVASVPALSQAETLKSVQPAEPAADQPESLSVGTTEDARGLPVRHVFSRSLT